MVAPLALHYRGLDRDISAYNIKDFKLAAKGMPIGGVQCDEYQLQSGAKSVVTIWTDPSLEQAVRKLRVTKDGIITDSFEIMIFNSLTGGPVPNKWKYSRFGPDGKAYITMDVSVDSSSAEIYDRPSAFQLIFPINCRVSDHRNGDKKYIINSEGSLVELDIYGNPVESSAISQNGASWIWRNRWILLTIAVVAAFGFAFMRYLGSSRRSISNQQERVS